MSGTCVVKLPLLQPGQIAQLQAGAVGDGSVFVLQVTDLWDPYHPSAYHGPKLCDCVLWDGVASMGAIFLAPVRLLAEKGSLQEGTYLYLRKYSCSPPFCAASLIVAGSTHPSDHQDSDSSLQLMNRKLMLMEVDVLGHGPIINSLSLLPSSPAAPTTPLAPGPAMPAPDDGAPAIHDLTADDSDGPSKQPQLAQPQQEGPVSNSATRLVPLAELRMGMVDWRVTARCSQKSDILRWGNASWQCSFDILVFDSDESAEIRCTCRGDAVQQYFDLIEVDRVHTIFGGSLTAGSALNGNHHACEIILIAGTTIIRHNSGQPTSIPIMYKMVSIKDAQALPANSKVNVISLVTKMSPVSEFKRKAGLGPGRKRTLFLRDDTAESAELSIYAEHADSVGMLLNEAHIKSKRPPIISIKQARIDGRSLHCYSTACIKIAPSDDAAAHALRQRVSLQSASAAKSLPEAGPSNTGGLAPLQQSCVKAVISVLWSRSREIVRMQVSGRVNVLKGKTLSDLMVPYCIRTSGANGQLCGGVLIQRQGAESRKCDSCTRTSKPELWQYRVRGELADDSGCVWFTAPREGADGLFGMTASSLRGLDEIQLQRRLVEAVHGRTYVFDLSIVPQKAVEVIRADPVTLVEESSFS